MSGGVGMGVGGRKCGPTRHWLHHARAVLRYRWQWHPTTSNPSHHVCLLALSQGKNTHAGSFSSCYWRRPRPCAARWHSHRSPPLCNSTEMLQGTPLPEGWEGGAPSLGHMQEVWACAHADFMSACPHLPWRSCFYLLSHQLLTLLIRCLMRGSHKASRFN